MQSKTLVLNFFFSFVINTHSFLMNIIHNDLKNANYFMLIS